MDRQWRRANLVHFTGRKRRDTKMATNDVREDRRRRIVERGSDRMALITGRIPTQDYPSSPLSSGHSRAISAPPLRLPSQEFKESSLPNLPDNTTVGGQGENEADTTTVQKHDISDGPLGGNAFEMRSQSLVPPRKRELTREVVEGPVMEERPEILPQVMTSPVHMASTGATDFRKQAHGKSPKLFTAKKINSYIIASETIRMFCALTIAFLVVLSYKSIVSSGSVIAPKPVYIVLLTDVTIVLAYLYIDKGISSEEHEDGKMGPQDDGHNWADAVKVLETAVAAYQFIRGIFIDCSIYAVVVICSLSLL